MPDHLSLTGRAKFFVGAYSTTPSHLAMHRSRSTNQIPLTSLRISRPMMQIFCSKHLSISSISNCVSWGSDDIESVACGKCAVSVEGDNSVNRIVCLIRSRQAMHTTLSKKARLLSMRIIASPPTVLSSSSLSRDTSCSPDSPTAVKARVEGIQASFNALTALRNSFKILWQKIWYWRMSVIGCRIEGTLP